MIKKVEFNMSNSLEEFLQKPFEKENGHCWQIALPQYANISDNIDFPERSNLQIYEDNALLGPAHSSHDTIRNSGRGHYSHWGESLYFSSLDNSNPNENGRKYTISIKNRDEELIQLEKEISNLDYVGKERIFKILVEALYELNGSSIYNLRILNSQLKTINTYFNSPENLNILELGVGKNLGLGLLLAFNGIKKYYALDTQKAPDFNNSITLQSIISIARPLFSPLLGQKEFQDHLKNVLTQENEKVVLNPEKIEFLYPYSATDLPI